ncbi:MAG: 3-deoxy-8-phosphooctulonate synthase [Planctomycetota bacterium]|jgi:2-dehydro-3-deoxyphosphooctonate aldolase (KDO 8-P synthase)
MGEVSITDAVAVGNGRPLLVVAGPCVIEGRQLCTDVAGHMKEACASVGLPYVFKASFDKANRTSTSSFRGVGIEDGLAILKEVKGEVGVPVLTDIHLPSQAEIVAQVVDVLQIPAFLCRQTDLVVAAAETGLPINVKKGQFMAPEDMASVVAKISSTGNARTILCERGTCFGYRDLVADMRSIVRMKAIGCPVLFDATHATQRPGALGTESGGEREMAPVLAAAAVAAGADGVFFETHPDPESGLSDRATMLPLDAVPPMLERLKAIAELSGKQ